MTPEQAELLLSMIEEIQISGQDIALARMEELLLVLGNIQGYLLFFVVVILLFFVYKFFRIFF